MSSKRKTNLLVAAGAGLALYKLYNLLKEGHRYYNFKDKVFLISGASRGLGLVLAKQLADQGAHLSIAARDQLELEEAKGIILEKNPQAQVLTLVCNSTDRSDVDMAVVSTVNTFGRLDGIINNAGIIAVSPYQDTTRDDFKESLDVHFWAAYNMTEAALPHLKKSPGSRIINISSIGGKIPVPHLSSYCTEKFALMGYSKTLRAELMKDNIYVTTVSPGLMRTGSQGHAEFKGQAEKEYSWFTVSGSLPFLTISAEKAARRILQASKMGRAEVVLTLPAKIITRLDTLSPEIFADALALTNKLLPDANKNKQNIKGQNLHSKIASSPVTALSAEAARRNNEKSL